jgi:hypothetical protein
LKMVMKGSLAVSEGLLILAEEASCQR